MVAGAPHLLDTHYCPSLAVRDTEQDQLRVVGAATGVNGGNEIGHHGDCSDFGAGREGGVLPPFPSR